MQTLRNITEFGFNQYQKPFWNISASDVEISKFKLQIGKKALKTSKIPKMEENDKSCQLIEIGIMSKCIKCILQLVLATLDRITDLKKLKVLQFVF